MSAQRFLPTDSGDQAWHNRWRYQPNNQATSIVVCAAPQPWAALAGCSGYWRWSRSPLLRCLRSSISSTLGMSSPTISGSDGQHAGIFRSWNLDRPAPTRQCYRLDPLPGECRRGSEPVAQSVRPLRNTDRSRLAPGRSIRSLADALDLGFDHGDDDRASIAALSQWNAPLRALAASRRSDHPRRWAAQCFNRHQSGSLKFCLRVR